MYRKILLTLDGSDLSATAIPHAVSIAKASSAPIVLLQVVDSVAHIMAQATPAGFDLGGGALTAQVAEEAVTAQRQGAQEHLEAAKAQLAAEGVTDVSTEIVEGSAGDAIVEAAARLGADLVVMATHGRSGLGRVLLGSVADHVVRNTPNAAVLLVRPQVD
jgi:nucleotide-binding universal stress UspA family protein